jgi:hypothetical protein
MRTVILLITSWVAGLAAYAGALKGWRGEVLSLDNWMVVGSITLVAWLLASLLVTLPVLRRLPLRPTSYSGTVLLAATGAMLAIVPVWLTLAVWAGWHPRYLLSQEAGLLGVLYGTSGAVLGLSLARIGSRVPPNLPRAVDGPNASGLRPQVASLEDETWG